MFDGAGLFFFAALYYFSLFSVSFLGCFVFLLDLKLMAATIANNANMMPAFTVVLDKVLIRVANEMLLFEFVAVSVFLVFESDTGIGCSITK